MAYILACQFVFIIGLIWLLDRSHKQEVTNARVQSEQHAAERADHLSRLEHLTATVLQRSGQPHPDLRELVGIVDRLCQRVQAPDVAVTEHAMAQPLPPMPQSALPDDDKSFWENQGFVLPKEDLATALDG